MIGKRNRKYEYQSHDIRFLLGDLNFRINMPFEEAKTCSINFSEEDMKLLNQNDQLTIMKNTDPVIGAFAEGKLNFRPTYKYDDN